MNPSEIAERAAREIRRHFDENCDTTIPGEVFDSELLQIVAGAIEESRGQPPEEPGFDEATETRWQGAIYEACKKAVGPNNDHLIDGGGCDSGDALDFTLAEIRQTFNILAESRGQRWIPVEEKLPEHGADVLLAFLSYNNKRHCLETGSLGDGPDDRGDHSLLWYSNNDYYNFDRVTHWQPLADPPKGNENV